MDAVDFHNYICAKINAIENQERFQFFTNTHSKRTNIILDKLDKFLLEYPNEQVMDELRKKLVVFMKSKGYLDS